MRTQRMTWWELCEKVEQKLREEPQNYCQLRYEVKKGYRQLFDMPVGRDCGTAYCIMGWMGHVTGNDYGRMERDLIKLLSCDAVNLLTSGGALHSYFGEDRGPVGTREYAEAGITHLRKFMTANESVLRNNYIPQG